MTNLPDHITLGPHRWRILTDADTAAYLTHGQENGTTDAAALTIRVDTRSMAHGALAETVLHEALHACWATAGLTAHDADEHDEQVVTSLAPQLLDLLRRNPQLVDWLTA